MRAALLAVALSSGLPAGAAPQAGNDDGLHAIGPAQVSAPVAARYQGPAPGTADEEMPRAARPKRPLGLVTVEVGLPEGALPRNYAGEWLAETAAPPGAVLTRVWPASMYQWRPTALGHRPLYFEEVNAERYGYSCSSALQPVISAAHFFGTIPALPYAMTVDPPQECIYTLGHYRPGSCPPWRRHCLPLQCDAATVQAGAVTGLIFLLP